MTPGEPGRRQEPGSPDDQMRIRALLAEARESGPLPEHVAARLDRVIDDLTAERGATDPVLDDGVVGVSRARRRPVIALLVAAAAVVVVGFGVGGVLSGDPADIDAQSLDTAVDRGIDGAPSPSGDGAGAAPTDDDLETWGATAGAKRGPYVVRERQLTRDLALIRAEVLPDLEAADYAARRVRGPRPADCGLPANARGVLVGVRYADRPAIVRFLAPMGDSQVVEVLQCDTGDLLRSTTLTTRD